ncbi:PKD domain-containing protein [Methanosarcina sp. MSH10X1]|uniref:PKD domain-containing protein n=1 Tax=Methanosarcina sp. MSH10X1 TaxID=2507075 RepID=UPI000FFB5033|nr:PKD domain-containing protein [Methanosarcina sp. MSH10X1]RXA17824.1 PKD domain-containing protein [Methanosarcina sp. MSH10X1]
MKVKLFLISLAFAFLTLIPTIASAGQEVRITSDGEWGFNPAIYDNKVIWLDGNFNGNIHMRELSTGKETQITGNHSCSWPAIYSDRIVWIDGRNGSDEVYTYNVSTGTETRTGASDSTNEGWKQDLTTYEDKIIWQTWHGDWGDIYVYDLSTASETRINTSNSSQGNPSIYGDSMVWTNVSNGSSYIFMYNLSTSAVTQITPTESAYCPDIYGDRIVYLKGNNLYLYNVSASIETQISYNESLKASPDIYGDRIVWQDYRNGNCDIYMYDLSTGQEVRITADKSDQLNPAIYGDRIVWQDSRNTDLNNYYREIYMYDLSDKPIVPFASFTINVTSGSGNVPLTVLFTDTSNGGAPSSWYWDFGDGINSKHSHTATHTFTKVGIYNVSLTVANDAGSSMVKKINCIAVTPPQAPVADFFSPQVNQANVHGIPTNKTLSFFDNSTGSPASWLWDFGDGGTSTVQNPAHIYSAMGGYTVTLTVANSAGSNTTSKYGYVLAGIGDESAGPAYFSADITNGSAPLTVTFLDDKDAELPNYPIWRDWDFGDGTLVSYGVDNNESASPYATHVYEKPGKYTVTLYLDNRGGKSIITKYNYITVTVPESRSMDFSANVTAGTAPLKVLFTDTSTGETPISWLWDFGDGTSSKHAMNATHTFTKPGTYNIMLTVTNKTDSISAGKSNYITVTP